MALITLGGTGLLFPDGSLGPGTVEVDGSRITAVSPGGTGLPDRLVVPGFIDLQVNGHGDVDVATASGSQWEVLDSRLLAQGVTSWCPTLISAPLSRYAAPLARVATAARRPRGRRPSILGAHLEGPFLGGAPGAHSEVVPGGVDFRWLESLPEVVRLITMAPECPGVVEAIEMLGRRGIRVSLGHSTASGAASAAAIDAGAVMATHLFNAMGPLHHREPGLAARALTDDRIAVSLIADGVHVDPSLLRLAFRVKPAASIILVTDAVGYAAPASRASLTGGAVRLGDGTLAGTNLTMDRAVRQAVHAGVGLADALVAATWAPARILGATDRGRLAPGTRADLVVLNPSLEVTEVWVSGERCWVRSDGLEGGGVG